MGKYAIFSDSANKPAPDWAMFWGFDDTEWNRYFERREDAIQYARLNSVVIKDLTTDEIIFDSFNRKENS